MSSSAEPVEILLVEDDPGDVLITREAIDSSKVANNLNVVSNGEEALAYLRRDAPFEAAARPGLILLDLNLPRLDGREVLALIKADADLRRIPVVVLTHVLRGRGHRAQLRLARQRLRDQASRLRPVHERGPPDR